MQSDDLSNVRAIGERQRAVLAGLGITTLRALVDADRGEIHGALRNLRPRTTLKEIAAWQDEARLLCGQAAAAAAPPERADGSPAADWEQAASFSVVFERRSGERWLVVEQDELEGARRLEEWASWDCSPICAWMQDQLRLNGLDTTTAAAEIAAAPAAATARASRPALAVVAVHVSDDEETRRISRAGEGAAEPLRCIAGTRLLVTVRGTETDQELHVVAWIHERNAAGGRRLGSGIERVRGKGRVEFPLVELAAGLHRDLCVVVYAPDGSAAHDRFDLPPLEIVEAPQ